MKKIWLLILFIPLFSFAQNESSLWKKGKAIHPLDDWMRDPYIVLGPDDVYYLTCTQHTEASENIKQALYTSTNLTDWKFERFIYSMNQSNQYDSLQALLQLHKNPKVIEEGLKLWAPEIHFIGERAVVVHTSNVGMGNWVFLDNKQVVGDFQSDWGATFGRNHDPSIFQDDDGSIWLLSKCTTIQEVKRDLSSLKGEAIQIDPSNRKMGHEGTFLIKINDKYVLFGTAWSTDNMRHGSYNLYYCTSDKLLGPYDERKFAGRFLGHGTPFKDKEGNWWCTAFYNANVPPVDPKQIKKMDTSDTAYTINKQGLTIVPLDIFEKNGEIMIKPRDENYQNPGKEETQKFGLR